jgi:poly-gamma-glutamate synthesis protein (capsule biosynthesis protein)
MSRRRTAKPIWFLIPAIIAIVLGVLMSSGGLRSKDISLSNTPVPTKSASPAKQGEASMLFVGDIMLSRSVGDLMAAKNNYLWPFEKIADFLKSADFTFANLETPVSNRGVKVGSIYSFRSDPRSINGLTSAGFDLVSIANNHAWDYGRDAFVDTMDHLSNADISYAGGGHSYQEAHDGVVQEIQGTKVGFLAYTNLLPKSLSASGNNPGLAIYDEKQMVDDIVRMKTKASVVVVSFHWGEEYHPVHNALQEQIAHTAIDAGADLIIGHHPHVPEDIEQYSGKYIVYSLGNFIFDQNWSAETMKGLAVRVWLKNNTIYRLEQIPINISKEYQASI